MHHIPTSGRQLHYKGRKRGRPRGDESVLSAIRAAEDHAKKLRAEFGLTGAQVKVQKARLHLKPFYCFSRVLKKALLQYSFHKI